MNNTPQGETTEGNAADDTLMVDQGIVYVIDTQGKIPYTPISKASALCNRDTWNLKEH